MDTSQIRVTEENIYPKYNLSSDEHPPYTSRWKECLSVHCDINDFLDEHLGGSRTDWAGKYHSWLSSFGIHPETDEGWWSRQAVMAENLQAFVLDYTDECFCERLDKLRDTIPKGNKIFKCKLSHSYATVLRMLRDFEHD